MIKTQVKACTQSVLCTTTLQYLPVSFASSTGVLKSEQKLPGARSLSAVCQIYTCRHRKVEKKNQKKKKHHITKTHPFKGMDLYLILNCVRTLWTPKGSRPHCVSKSKCLFSFLLLIANCIFHCFSKISVELLLRRTFRSILFFMEIVS